MRLQLEAHSAVGEIALALGDGEKASLPQAPVPSNKLRLWRADTTLGQPGLDAGEGFGAANGSALALVSTKTLPPLRVWNAGGRENLRLSLKPVEVALLAEVKAESQTGALLPPFSALPVRVKGRGADRVQPRAGNRGRRQKCQRTQGHDLGGVRSREPNDRGRFFGRAADQHRR